MDQPHDSNPPEPVQQETARQLTPALANSIFVDARGVRPIWRCLIYAGGYYALRSFLLMIAAETIASREGVSPPWLMLLQECMLLLAALFPAWLLSKLEAKPFGAYGLPGRGAFGRQFWGGTVWGIAAITLLLLAMHGAGVFDFGRPVVHGVRVFKFAAFWGIVFLVVGLYEDFLFRGYSLITFSEAVGFWPAAVLLSLTFGGLHLGNFGESWVGALAAACIGLFWCLTLRRTGTLWFAVGMHAAWDWGETFLYSVPDSGITLPGHLLRSSFHGPRWLTGGSVGPEGSVLVFILIALLWLVFDRVYPAKRHETRTDDVLSPH